MKPFPNHPTRTAPVPGELSSSYSSVTVPGFHGIPCGGKRGTPNGSHRRGQGEKRACAETSHGDAVRLFGEGATTAEGRVLAIKALVTWTLPPPSSLSPPLLWRLIGLQSIRIQQ